MLDTCWPGLILVPRSSLTSAQPLFRFLLFLSKYVNEKGELGETVIVNKIIGLEKGEAVEI